MIMIVDILFFDVFYNLSHFAMCESNFKIYFPEENVQTNNNCL